MNNEVYYIRDMKINLNYEHLYNHWSCVIFVGDLNKTFHVMDNYDNIRVMCMYMNAGNYNIHHVYEYIIRVLIQKGRMNRNEVQMYNDYFSTDNWIDESLTENMKKRKQEQFDNFENKIIQGACENIHRNGMSFWSSLIIKDILK